MDRPITYVGQSVLEWLFTKPAQDSMLALGKALQAVAGTGPFVVGLACTPNSPAALNVLVGEGEIYQSQNVEASTMGTLPADTSHQVLKQGMLRNSQTIACAAPGTAGQSINYLIQATYQDQDVSIDPTTGATNVVLQFFSGVVGGTPYSGPGNSGATSNTFRKGGCVVSAKAGAAAATGSQTTPSPDAGYVGLYVVTVANGQTQITSGNIVQLATAPFLTGTLGGIPGNVQSGTWVYAGTAGGTANALTATLTPAPSGYTTGSVYFVKVATTNTGAATANFNGLGNKSIVRNDDGSALAAGDLPANAVVPLLYDGTSLRLMVLPSIGIRAVRSQVAPGAGTWTCPAGVTSVRVRAWGAGGGGGASNSTTGAGGGGGGGGYAEAIVAVVPGTGYAVALGAAGAAGTGSGAGSAGGSTTFASTTVVATGGGGGGGATAGVAGSSGAGGTGTAGTITFSGGQGETGRATGAVIGGGGGDGAGGASGAGAGGNGAGGAAAGNGGGGGGSINASGGAGAGGQLILEW